MIRNQGIILKTYVPKKCKISLLDKKCGKIEVISPRVSFLESLLPGMVVTYFLWKRPGCLDELRAIELDDVPLTLARRDIYFFHHVLELCYYFLPLNLAVGDIYDLILFLLESSEKISSTMHKKLFLLRFFLYLGMYPEEDEGMGKSFEYLLYDPIDIMLEKTIIISETILEQWLLACMQTHLPKVQLKTLLMGCKDVLQSN